ncbi:MAG: hypothetical protein PVH03_11970, partial [Chloroflexota bacterium]
MSKSFDILDLAQPPFPALLRFYDHLLAGDVTSLANLFTGQPHLNTPLRGKIKGDAELERYVIEEQTWLRERNARLEFFNVIVSDERIVL